MKQHDPLLELEFDNPPPSPEELQEREETQRALSNAGITQVPWVMVGRSTKKELDFMCTVSQFAYHWDDKKAFDDYLKKENNPTEEELREQGYDVQYVTDEESAMQCVVITKGNDIHIGFRGTLFNRKHIAKDLNATLVTAGFIEEGRIHGGFYHGARSLMPQLSTVLDAHAKKQGKSLHDFNFKFTGHSMGGAIAKVTALYIHKEWKISADKMKVATFGDPRTFDVKAAGVYDAALGKGTVRVSEYGQDVVPKVPSGSMGFKHVGELIKIKKPTNLATSPTFRGLQDDHLRQTTTTPPPPRGYSTPSIIQHDDFRPEPPAGKRTIGTQTLTPPSTPRSVSPTRVIKR
jgi:hypothetical protein